MIDLRTRLVALVCGVALLIFIIDLVRRRKLKEEYSVLWVTTALVMLVLSVWFTPLEWLTRLIGGVTPSSTIFLLGLLFVFFMLLHFSLRVSALERRHVALVQEIGLMSARAPELSAPAPPSPPRTQPRTTVIIPCFNDGEYTSQAIASVREEEPVEIVVVNDGSTDADTLARLAALERAGTRVVNQENVGLGGARTAGLAASTAPYVFALDSDDLLEPGVLAAMADLLDARDEVGFIWGDYVLFGAQEGSYRSPSRWLPWTLTYVNPYPVCSMFRREVLTRADAWQGRYYEDWNLWLRLAEQGAKGVSFGTVIYRRRIHADGRLAAEGRALHKRLYPELVARNAALFDRRDELRRHERPALWQRLIYPVVFGHRRILPIRVETALRHAMMRMGSGLPG